ncbi:hypothetical protein [Aeromonas allosaccharophila]|uniref:Uncharacterized protein n=1 Tax=Aeromonas allosaccharophila TaxID=656 RepID=A0AAX3P0V8_9GAMM|nr:hypothetical protein [Aeromonas allosaccharophila]WED78053.1 hypothetical protein PYU98_07465 [Aeromonas allosaccharophila]
MKYTVLIPTFIGHIHQAKELISSIKRSGEENNFSIKIVISIEEKEKFDEYEFNKDCTYLYVENLIEKYIDTKISASELLNSVGKFKYQALKKILGVVYSGSDSVLILDSETHIVKNLSEIFLSGIEGTSVLYSSRNWERIPLSLTTEVRDEVNSLLQQNSDKWFFESFNWVYDVESMKLLLGEIEKKYTKKWVFRSKPLFECQLYYQYIYSNRPLSVNYRFINVESLYLSHFGHEHGSKILERFWNSPFPFNGVVEYSAQILTKKEYIDFVSDPEVLQHLRLVRHEPISVYDIVNSVHDKIKKCERAGSYYYGEASMHRGDFTRGRICILLSGRFNNPDDVLNIKNFLLGVDCDLFVATSNDCYLIPFIQDNLSPISISEVDDNFSLGEREALLSTTDSFEQDVKAGRDVGSMSMFDKINLAYHNMLEYEKKSGFQYSIIVRLRPDIFSVKRLKDVFYQVSEYASANIDGVFFPNRFWSQGINDQFFFGKRSPMSSILEGVSGSNYIKASYINPEFYMAELIQSKNIKPVAFDFCYILTRSHYDDVYAISSRFHSQESLFWSKTIEHKCWRDLSGELSRIISNVLIKNSEIRPNRFINNRSKECDLFYGKAQNGSYVFISEHKSADIIVCKINKFVSLFISYLVILGYPFPFSICEKAWLTKYDKSSGILHASLGEKELSVNIYTPKPALLIWFAIRLLRHFRLCFQKSLSFVKLSIKQFVKLLLGR